MAQGSTEQRLDALFETNDPWSAIGPLVEHPPEDLIACIEARLSGVRGKKLERLADLLASLGPPGRPLLLTLLGRGQAVTARALAALSTDETPLDYDALLPWLQSDDESILRAAIGAAGFVGDPRLVERVFEHWDSPRRFDVALCLGRMHATDYTAELVAVLTEAYGELDRQKWEHCAVALELMADPACIPEICVLLQVAPEDKVWSLVQILRAATGEDRFADWTDGGRERDVEALRRAWLDDEPAPLGVIATEPQTSSMAEILLQGTGRVRIGYPPPVTAGNWARWSRALYCGDTILYHANSDCPTCETFLARAGAERPRVDADRIGAHLRDVTSVSSALIEGLTPALLPLPSGRARVALVEIQLERIDEPRKQDSWYSKRGLHRRSDDPEFDDPEDTQPAVTWPGTAHYQAINLIEASPPTSMTVMPTQSIKSFDESVIEARTAAMDRGEHPAALAIGWFEDRSIVASFPEAMLQLVVLDGHHTLEAYVRSQRPARILVVGPFVFGYAKAARAHLERMTPRDLDG